MKRYAAIILSILLLVFWGDLPGYGISYVDANGDLRYFAIEVSGEDGALLLREADSEGGGFVLYPSD